MIILARGVRTFAQGFVAVLLALYLTELGFSLVQIGTFLSVGVLGVAFFAFLVSLIFFSMISASAGLALFFVDHFLILLVFAFLGSLSTGGGGGGESPAQPLEVASLPDTAPDDKRTDLFAIYNIVARTGAALGALAAGLPALYQGAFNLTTLDSYRFMFILFAGLQIAGALLYGLLSTGIEGASTERRWSNPFKLPSRRRIFTLTGLFSVDTFTTSMVTQSLMAYWFSTKFGLELGSLALVFTLVPLGGGFRANGMAGRTVLAASSLPGANGQPDPRLLHDGYSWPRRKGRYGQHTYGGPERVWCGGPVGDGGAVGIAVCQCPLGGFGGAENQL